MNRRIEPAALNHGRWALNSLGLVLFCCLLAGCSARQVQDNLAGATAQRLVTYAIDELVSQIPEQDFAAFRGQTLVLESHFITGDEIRSYADQRLARELNERFGIQVIVGRTVMITPHRLSVFYTALGTDTGLLGFYLPLGFVPGVDETTRINLITLEQFHGVAEMYYYIESDGQTTRGARLLGRTRTDALGLPIITIPISSLD